MITLITGSPGTGKTAWLVHNLVEMLKTQKFRKLFIHGVRGLKIAHTPVYCRSELCDICQATEKPEDALYVEDWPKWKSTNDMIVVDEVQRVWRPTSPGAKVHPSISGLETHRHYGLDFILITQAPGLLIKNVRVLVGRHIHLNSTWSGRSEHEFSHCKENLESLAGSVQRPYKLPKKVYDLYESAEVHTKLEKRPPLALYGLIGSVLIGAVLIAYIAHRVNERVITAEDTRQVDASMQEREKIDSSVQMPANKGATKNQNFFPDFKPVVDGVPESAPAYSDVLKVSSVPIMMGCVQSKMKCTCYTSQATVYPTSQIYCEETIQNHRFNPYLVSDHVVLSNDTLPATLQKSVTD